MVGSTKKQKVVFVAYRQHNNLAKSVMDRFLRAQSIEPRDIDDIRIRSGPDTITDRLKQAYGEEAQAFLILLTPDNYSTILPLWNEDRTGRQEIQPRQNVVLEAGMAIGLMMPSNEEHKVILVELVKPEQRGSFSGPSNWTGLHNFTLNSEDHNKGELGRLIKRLKDAGCNPSRLSLENRELFAVQFEDAILRPREWHLTCPIGDVYQSEVTLGDNESLLQLDLKIVSDSPHWRAGFTIGPDVSVPPSNNNTLLFHLGATDSKQGLTWFKGSVPTNGGVTPRKDNAIVCKVYCDRLHETVKCVVNGNPRNIKLPRDSYNKLCLSMWGDGYPYEVTMKYDHETESV